MKLTNAELQNLYYTYRPDEWAKDYIEPENDIVLDEWQKSFLTDDRRRILLLIHRQGGKSTAVAIKAVHRAVFRDDQTILLFSPTQRQSSELFYNVRKMIKSVPDYENLLTVDNVTSLELTNGSRIISLPGTNWNIRGYRADMVIIDEAAGVPDEVFDAVSPMLLTTNGQFIQLSTPNKKKGAFYNSYQSEAWGRYTVKVSDNPRMQTPDKQQFLKAELTDRGSRVYSQEYECEFLSNIEGGTFNRSWYRFVDDPMNGQYKVRYWDLAASETRGDWVSATKMSMTDGEYCIEHSIHFQGTAKEVKDLLISTCEKEGEYMSVVIELEGGSESKMFADTITREYLPGYNIRFEYPTGSKEIRAGPYAAALEAGNVSMVRAQWNDDLIDEQCEFPFGDHDDQVDSCTGAFNTLNRTFKISADVSRYMGTSYSNPRGIL